MVEGKKNYLLSKTLWFNLVTFILAVLSLADVQTLVPAKYVALINGVGNFVLRIFFTNTQLTK